MSTRNLGRLGIVNLRQAWSSESYHPEQWRLQTKTAAELGALLPAILDRAFTGEL